MPIKAPEWRLATIPRALQSTLSGLHLLAMLQLLKYFIAFLCVAVDIQEAMYDLSQ